MLQYYISVEEAIDMKRRRAYGLLALVVGILIIGGGIWIHIQQRQYALNRQLIDALTHNDAKTALALVNAGADPNTRQSPPTVPSFKLLYGQLVHHKGSPVNESPTALLLACDGLVDPIDGVPVYVNESSRDVSLVQIKLSHGADVNAQDEIKCTGLAHAIIRNRIHTMELLLQHGADVNV